MEKDDPEHGVWHGEWRFSQSTLAVLERLYQEHAFERVLPEAEELGYHEHLSLGLRIERAVPATMRTQALGLALWKWCGLAILLLFAIVIFGVGAFVARLVGAPLRRAFRIETEPENANRVSRAIAWLAILYAAHRAVAVNVLLLTPDLLAFLYPFFASDGARRGCRGRPAYRSSPRGPLRTPASADAISGNRPALAAAGELLPSRNRRDFHRADSAIARFQPGGDAGRPRPVGGCGRIRGTRVDFERRRRHLDRVRPSVPRGRLGQPRWTGRNG